MWGMLGAINNQKVGAALLSHMVLTHNEPQQHLGEDSMNSGDGELCHFKMNLKDICLSRIK